MTDTTTLPNVTQTFTDALKAALGMHERVAGSGAHAHEENMKALVKQLETAAGNADRQDAKHINRLVNIVHSLNDHLDDIRDHHLGDEKHVREADALITSAKEAIGASKSNEASLIEKLEACLKHHNVTLIGATIRDPNIPMHKEYLLQVKDGIGNASVLGKMMGMVGGSVSLGVVAHGGLNVKRGLLGYHDPETGEQKSGALSTLIVGIGEMAAGLVGLKKALTGRWGFGRAVHARAHGHHHDHDHGHGGCSH